MDSGQVNKRNGNRYAILRALQFDGPSRRGQIARKYGIRQSSVTGIAAELLQAGLIREQQPGNSRSLLELDTSRFHALVGNLTPAFCRIACVYLDGRIAESREISLVHALDAPAILDTVARFHRLEFEHRLNHFVESRQSQKESHSRQRFSF